MNYYEIISFYIKQKKQKIISGMQKSLIIATPQENPIHPLLPSFQCCPHEHCKTLVSIVIDLHSKLSSQTQLHDIPCQCANIQFIEQFEKIYDLKQFEDGTKTFKDQLIQMRKNYELIWKEVQVLRNQNIKLSERNQKLWKQRQQINNKLTYQQGQTKKITTKLKQQYQAKIQKLLQSLLQKDRKNEDWISQELTSYEYSMVKNSKFINSQQEQLLISQFYNNQQNQLKVPTAHFLQITEDIQTKRKPRKSSKLNVLINTSSQNQKVINSQQNHQILLNEIEKRDHQIISLKSACHGLKQYIEKLKSYIMQRQSIQHVRCPAIKHLKDILSDLDL